jgi:hypothetical protein
LDYCYQTKSFLKEDFSFPSAKTLLLPVSAVKAIANRFGLSKKEAVHRRVTESAVFSQGKGQDLIDQATVISAAQLM